MFDRQPSWSLDANQTGKSTKCSWAEVEGSIAWGHPYPRTGILYFPQFRSHQETKRAARRTRRSTQCYPVLISKFQSEDCSLSHTSKQKNHILFPLKPTADACIPNTCQYGSLFRRERNSVSLQLNTREIQPPTCSLNQQKPPSRVHYLYFFYKITPFIIQLR